MEGALSDGQVEVIVACVTDRRAPLWAEHEAAIIPLLEPLDVIDTNRAMRDWASKADAVLTEPPPPEEPPAQAMLVTTLDGRGYLKGTFDAEHTEVLGTALRLAGSSDLDIPLGTRQGQALADVCRFFLDHQHQKLGGRHRPHLNVVVEEPALRDGKPGRTLAGVPLPGSTIRKIACDANLHRVITDGRLVDPRLRAGRPHHPPGRVHLAGGARLGLPVPGLRPTRRVERRPPHPALGRRRTHLPLEPRALVLEAPPRGAPTWLAHPPRPHRHG